MALFSIESDRKDLFYDKKLDFYSRKLQLSQFMIALLEEKANNFLSLPIFNLR